MGSDPSRATGFIGLAGVPPGERGHNPFFRVQFKNSLSSLIPNLFYSPTMKTRLDRREFVKLAGTAGIVAATADLEQAFAFQQTAAPGPDAAEKDLVMLALDAVRSAGASYADVRITRGNTESIATRERQ